MGKVDLPGDGMGYTRIDKTVRPLPQEQEQELHGMRSYPNSRANFESASPGYGDGFTQYTGYDPVSTQTYAPPAGPPPSSGEKGRLSENQQYRGQLPSTKVWAMNKLRGFILVFDVFFHSTPLMFIGRSRTCAY